MLIRTQ